MIQRNPPLTSRTRPRHRPASRRVRGRPRRGRRLCSASRLRRRRRGFRRRSRRRIGECALPARARERRVSRLVGRSTNLYRSARAPRARTIRDGARETAFDGAEDASGRMRSRVIVRGRCARRYLAEATRRAGARAGGRLGGTGRCTNIWRRGSGWWAADARRRRRWWRRYRARCAGPRGDRVSSCRRLVAYRDLLDRAGAVRRFVDNLRVSREAYESWFAPWGRVKTRELMREFDKSAGASTRKMRRARGENRDDARDEGRPGTGDRVNSPGAT